MPFWDAQLQFVKPFQSVTVFGSEMRNGGVRERYQERGIYNCMHDQGCFIDVFGDVWLTYLVMLLLLLQA